MTRVPQAGAIAMRTTGGATEALIVRAKKDPSQWVFPKGHIEPGETAADAAVRELAEEAGVSGMIIQRVGVSAFRSGAEQVEVTYFLVRFVRRVSPSEERAIAWLPLEDARERLSFDDARRLLDQAARIYEAR